MIVLYSTHCPQCRRLEAMLKEKNIEYTINGDVSEMLKLGIRSVPYLSVDGKLLNNAEAISWVKGYNSINEN